jgi:aminomethyltransferase
MVPFAGWNMPVQYTSILEEHRTVREQVGLFDVSHMGEVIVTGPESAAFLDHLLTNHIAPLAVGRAIYTVMCLPSGGVIDDLIVYRLEAEKFLLVVNAGNADKDWNWIQEQATDFECSVENKSDDYALLALQGPKAGDVLTRLGAAMSELKRFALCETSICGHPVIIARTGYTGEDGFEIFTASQTAESLAEILLLAGQADGLKLIGLGARDSLRLEAGYPLYGHELSDEISPLMAGLKWVVKLDKPGDFIGKTALAKEATEGSKARVIWFKTEGRRIPRMDTIVVSNDGPVGRVLSGTLSPILNTPIGSALIEADADPTSLTVDLRGTRVPLLVTRPPLHKA